MAFNFSPRQGILTLFDDITYAISKDVIGAIAQYQSTSEYESLLLIISSGGGSLYSAFGLYDCIRHSSIPIDTLAVGYCASAALMLTQAARIRYSYEHTTFLLHHSNMRVEEQTEYAKFLTITEDYKRDHNLFLDLCLQRSGIDREEGDKVIQNQLYLKATEAKEFGPGGLVDVILKSS